MKYPIITLFILALCLGGCKNQTVRKEIDKAYSRDTLVKIASNNFDDAIQYVIEGEVNGKLTPYQANYLCAQLTYQFTPNNLVAVKYCQNALLALNVDDNYQDRVETLYLLSNVAYAALDLNTCIKAALEGKALAHNHKMYFEEASFDYIVGRCRFNMGEMEGLDIMRESIYRARKYAEKRIEFGHLVFFVGDLSLCYAALGHTQTEYMYNLLNELDIHEQIVNEMESRFPQAKDYCDRNRHQIAIYRAVANAALGNTEKAETYMKLGLTSRFAYYPSEYPHHIEYYAEMGNIDSVLAISKKFPFEGDTIQRTFRRELSLMELAYRKAGDINMANEYHKRYLLISELIDKRELQEGLEKNSQKYESQNYLLALNDYEDSMTRLRGMLAIVLVLIVVFTTLGYFVHRRRAKSINQRMAYLQKQMRMMQQKKTKSAKPKNSATSE